MLDVFFLAGSAMTLHKNFGKSICGAYGSILWHAYFR